MAGMKTQNTHIAINEIGSQALNVNDGGIPEIIPLMSVGRNDGRDGRTFFVSNAEEVIKATDAFRGNADLLLDYNHQSEYARENEKAAGIVEKAINEGRLPPALKENAVAMAKTQGETALNEWLTLIKPVSGKDAPTDTPALKTDVLTAEDKAVCQSLGLTEEEFKKGMENA